MLNVWQHFDNVVHFVESKDQLRFLGNFPHISSVNQYLP